MDEYVLVAQQIDDYKLVVPPRNTKKKNFTISSNGLIATRLVGINIDEMEARSYSLLVSKNTLKVKIKLYKTRIGELLIPEWCIKQSKLNVRLALNELGLERPVTTKSVKACGKTIIMEF
jgi:hypothetical protein